MQKSNIISEAFQCIPELVFVVSENGRYHALGGITEHHPEDIVGKTIDELFPVDVQPFFYSILHAAFSKKAGSVTKVEYQLKPSDELHIALEDDITRTFELSITPLPTPRCSERVAVCLCRDITELRDYERRLKSLSETDALTGVYNRAKLINELEQAYNEYMRYQSPACFLLFDLDNFKRINDKYGHLIGDKVICHFASVCSAEHRVVDTFARLGGDEFGLLMPNVTIEEATIFLERMHCSLAKLPFISKSLTLEVSVSIGVSEFSPFDASIEAIIQRADHAMYQSKYQHR
ncbi:diguanylate cyclase [Vibrio cholerae]|nr:diguanylate cyclase [Vibrio cholerae]EKF9604834.1 diguanylate cyclase [Vibrio cholerae]